MYINSQYFTQVAVLLERAADADGLLSFVKRQVTSNCEVIGISCVRLIGDNGTPMLEIEYDWFNTQGTSSNSAVYMSLSAG